MQIKSKLNYYNKKLKNVQKNINELDKNIEVSRATKIKVCILF